MKWEVIITIFDWHHATKSISVRLPPLNDEMKVHDLARACKFAYPNGLIEIAHNGIRRCA